MPGGLTPIDNTSMISRYNGVHTIRLAWQPPNAELQLTTLGGGWFAALACRIVRGAPQLHSGVAGRADACMLIVFRFLGAA